MEILKIQSYNDRGLIVDDKGLSNITTNNNEVLSGGPSLPLNTFDVPPLRDGVPVLSTVNIDNLITRIQADSVDTYFDSSSKFGRVFLYFTYSGDGRQEKMITHTGDPLTGNVFWTTNAKDGTWELTKAVSMDTDGAMNILNRAAIGTDSDVVLP
jgi:hypothetical protein